MDTMLDPNPRELPFTLKSGKIKVFQKERSTRSENDEDLFLAYIPGILQSSFHLTSMKRCAVALARLNERWTIF